MNTLETAALTFNREGYTDQALLDLYRAILLPRMIEEKMLILLRQGKVSKWFSGIGQEAIAVGATLALDADEFVFPLHRNLGVFTSREVPLDRLFCQWQGKDKGFTKGRDRSFHFGTPEHHIVGMISHLGPQLSLAGGVALAHKLSKEKKVSLAFSGEGATSEGDFHEALNVAAVWDLPVIFLVENNGYGLSTTTAEQFKCAQIADKGIGYGMRSLTIDGNNILEVHRTMQTIVREMREKPEPFLLECMTFRRRGHEEASGTKYVPQDLMDHWEKKDPVQRYEEFLLEIGVLQPDLIEEIKKGFKEEINKGLDIAFNEPPVIADLSRELADVYVPVTEPPKAPVSEEPRELRFVDAIADGLSVAMSEFDNLVLMGQDIAGYGGVFKITEGLMDRFGADRVRNTPLCESAIIGIGIGLGLKGYKSMVEMQFADFVSCGFNQIVNNAAKLHYRWSQGVDLVVRMPTGAGVGAGPFHSQSNEAWFFHTPGLKIVYPSNPHDAKGLLLAALEDPNPVIYFEHKALYRSLKGNVPTGYYTEPIGKAALVRSGAQVSVITYGSGVHWAVETTEKLGINADILDLRTLLPLDYEAIAATVQRTGKVLILHEATLTGGVGAELAAYISEQLFEYLDAPVMRVAGLDTPVPFAANLEKMFLPQERLETQLRKLIAY
ncbi:MAG: dehydrogenase E1 component subunit alpha/beta [Saprospiraceae bacterium]|nr:dehydrogenase E1 component subunit alpha/beta [Saprospiraceae bacterium]MDP4820677.1 dehydrogenase E1 component subunit alpha/beta [Saprospiraceae bacterium]MDP4998966.1 dehydrogenase E1 component subunit alpha/beta [Saprospiraceae bacterium]